MLSNSTPGQVSLKTQQWVFTFAFSSMVSVRFFSIAKTGNHVCVSSCKWRTCHSWKELQEEDAGSTRTHYVSHTLTSATVLWNFLQAYNPEMSLGLSTQQFKPRPQRTMYIFSLILVMFMGLRPISLWYNTSSIPLFLLSLLLSSLLFSFFTTPIKTIC